MNMHRSHAPSGRGQRGVAALVVVMVMFFVVSLVAAYTNRNLIFEQRTSSNLTRATQSFEAAQAGIDWAVAMVNGGRIDASCNPSANAGDTTFRDRYLQISTASGVVTPRDKSAGGADPRLSAACVYDGANWNCSCPVDGDPAPPVPAGDGQFPAFRVRFSQPIGNPSGWPGGTPVAGIVRLESVACPGFDFGAGRCLDFGVPTGGQGRQFMSVVLALNSAVKTAPAAALTARGGVATGGGANMKAYNDGTSMVKSFASRAAVGVQAGGAVGSGISAYGAGGSPAASAIVDNDASLNGLTGLGTLLPDADARMFSTVFGLAPDDYRQQPASFVLSGCPCNAATLRNAILMNPGRPIWISGDVSLDSAGAIGSSDAPVVLVVDGNLSASTAVTVYGVVYVRANTWNLGGNVQFIGAAVAEQDFTSNSASTFVYDDALLWRTRFLNGSFVPIPSSWKDFSQ